MAADRPTLVLFLPVLAALASGCRTSAPPPIPSSPRSSADLARQLLAKDPDVLAITGSRFDGGSCGALVFRSARGCVAEVGHERDSREGAIETRINSDSRVRAACGDLLDACGEIYACVCGDEVPPRSPDEDASEAHDGGSPTRAPRVRQVTLRRLDCAGESLSPDAGALHHAAESSGALIATSSIREAKMTKSFGGSETTRFALAMGVTGDSKPSLPHLEMIIPNFALESLGHTIPDFQVTQASGSMLGPQGEHYVLRAGNQPGAPSSGLVEFLPVAAEKVGRGVDYSVEDVHGCLSARLDEELADGGAGLRAVYLQASF